MTNSFGRLALGLSLALGIASAHAADIPKFTAKLIKATAAPMGTDVLGDGSKTITLQIAVTNDGSRDISLIDAKVVFTDRLEAPIASVKWENNRGIAAGKTVKMTGSYWTLEVENIERLVAIAPEDLVVTFDVSKLAYKGGEVVKIKD